jgi:hypothetical protein
MGDRFRVIRKPMKYYYGFIILIVFFIANCFLLRQYIENQLHLNPLCGHTEIAVGYKFGTDQWDGIGNGGSCFVRFPQGVMTLWNVGDCRNTTEPVEYLIVDYTCH